MSQNSNEKMKMESADPREEEKQIEQPVKNKFGRLKSKLLLLEIVTWMFYTQEVETTLRSLNSATKRMLVPLDDKNRVRLWSTKLDSLTFELNFHRNENSLFVEIINQ